jgi:flavodoxin
MKTSIICSSYTGTTQGIAEQIRDACGGDLIEITSRDFLSRIVTFMARHSPGMKVRDSGTMPERIDLSGSDIVVVGTPVWGGKPVPAIRNAITRFKGCEGKPVVIFATCSEKPGKTLEVLSKDLAARGMSIAGQFSLNKKEIDEGTLVTALIAKIREAGNTP